MARPSGSLPAPVRNPYRRAMATPDRTPSEVGGLEVAPRRVRTRRQTAFQIYLLSAAVVFVALALMARARPYFAIDLTITRALQSIDHPAFAALMLGLSWLGFLPQVALLGTVTVLIVFLAGLKWEAASLSFASLGMAITTLVKFIVYRPRPSADLVHVLNELSSPSFPSGHVVTFAVFCGFLLFMAYTLLQPSWARRAIMLALGLIIALMGPSRIYLGHHWFSDVMGAYLLGSLWLAVTIQFYRRGKRRSARPGA
jgi:undecaprenyl-diphosphatase